MAGMVAVSVETNR